jgi:hypothetical protein
VGKGRVDVNYDYSGRNYKKRRKHNITNDTEIEILRLCYNFKVLEESGKGSFSSIIDNINSEDMGITSHLFNAIYSLVKKNRRKSYIDANLKLQKKN